MVLKYPIKLWIKKKFAIRSDWNRFKPVESILLEENSWIKTEADLCKYIYERHGEGRYLILAYAKGVEGFWKYFLGNLYPNGFQRDLDKNKEMDYLKGQLSKAGSFEERESIEEEIDLEREIAPIEKSSRRHGPIGIIKARPGILHSYTEEIREDDSKI